MGVHEILSPWKSLSAALVVEPANAADISGSVRTASRNSVASTEPVLSVSIKSKLPPGRERARESAEELERTLGGRYIVRMLESRLSTARANTRLAVAVALIDKGSIAMSLLLFRPGLGAFHDDEEENSKEDEQTTQVFRLHG